jgi:hypothetical protein
MDVVIKFDNSIQSLEIMNPQILKSIFRIRNE